MIRTVLCLLLASALLAAGLPAAAQLVESWRVPQDACMMATDQQGNVYVASTVVTYPGFLWPPADAVVTKYDPDGNVVWATAFRPHDAPFDIDLPRVQPQALVVDGQGNVYVTACCEDYAYAFDWTCGWIASHTGHYVARLYSNGDMGWQDFIPSRESEWHWRYGEPYDWRNSPPEDTDAWDWVPVALSIGPDGSIFVSGGRFFIAGGCGYDIPPAYYNTGNPTWGFGWGHAGVPYVAKYSPDGVRQWLKSPARDLAIRWEGSWDRLCALVADSDNGVRLMGQRSELDSGVVSVKFDANGNELWRKLDPIAGWNQVRIGSTDSQGNVIVAGAVADDSWSDFRAMIAKYDPNGDRVWLKEYSASGLANHWPFFVASGPEDSVYVGVWSWEGDLERCVTLKYGASGDLAWSPVYGGPDSASGEAMGVDSVGDSYLAVTNWVLDPDTGWSESPGLLKYSAAGALLWSTDAGEGYYRTNCIMPAGEGALYTLGWDWDQGWLTKYLPNTPAGNNVVVEPGLGVALTFAAVTTPGGTTATTSPTGPQPPTGFRLGSPSIYYDIVTEAVFSGQIQVALNYGGVSYRNEKALRLFHYENGAWVNVTTSVDTANKVIHGIVSSLSPFVIAEPDVVDVTIDIKPGSYPNTINLGSNGTVPVAILSTADFDATKVDPLTVTLASAPVKLKGKGTPMFSIEDVDRDGRPDMLVHVSTQALVLSPNDTEAVLEGNTTEGIYIRGSDTVRVVP
jgi:hypothetical protein